MCNNNYNIKIVEGNAFALLFPLKARTYTANGQPTDTDIDCTQLQDCKVIIGGVEYTPELGADGVRVIMPATLKRATYNATITAIYQSSDIKAAYFEAFTIVAWNSQSNAEQYVQGSPVIMPAAFCIMALGDTELQNLKEQLQQKIAETERAKEAYEQAKADYDAKAEMLDDVAKQSTLTSGVQTLSNKIDNINIDTSDLAKQTQVKDGNDTAISVGKEIRSEVGTGSDTAAETGTLFAVVKWVKDKVKSIFNSIGTPAEGQPSTLFAAIASISGGDDGKQTIVDAINQMGGDATMAMTWSQLAYQIENVIYALENNVKFTQTTSRPLNLIGLYTNLLNGVEEINDNTITTLPQNAFYSSSLQNNTLRKITMSALQATEANSFRQILSLQECYLENATAFYASTFDGCKNVYKINMLRANYFASYVFYNCFSLVDLIIGSGFTSDIVLAAYGPTEAYKTNVSTLCFQTDIEEYGQAFSSNWDKWKWCIINHFAANLQDRTGMTAYTITLGANALSHFDTEMTQAFTSKNWTLA